MTEITNQPEQDRKPIMRSPTVDIAEGSDDIALWVDLPGIRDEDLRVTLDKNVLTIDAMSQNRAPPAGRLEHQEYQQGAYHRAFTISDAVDQDGITAKLSNGVLKLVLPKTEPARPRTITVSA